MLSLKDYAKQRNISYEAVRKQIVRYRDDLEGHIFRQNRTQYLDEDAVAFLDERRASNPIVIFEQNKDEEIQRLREEKELLLNELAAVQKKLIATQDLLLEHKDEIAKLTAANQALLTSSAHHESEAAAEVAGEQETEESDSRSFWQKLGDLFK